MQALACEANDIGVRQQKLHHIEGERYGFFTVINESFFEGGPTVRHIEPRAQLKRPTALLLDHQNILQQESSEEMALRIA